MCNCVPYKSKQICFMLCRQLITRVFIHLDLSWFDSHYSNIHVEGYDGNNFFIMKLISTWGCVSLPCDPSQGYNCLQGQPTLWSSYQLSRLENTNTQCRLNINPMWTCWYIRLFSLFRWNIFLVVNCLYYWKTTRQFY